MPWFGVCFNPGIHPSASAEPQTLTQRALSPSSVDQGKHLRHSAGKATREPELLIMITLIAENAMPSGSSWLEWHAVSPVPPASEITAEVPPGVHVC